MACPKKKSGRSARGHRRAQWKAIMPTMGKCSNCGEMKHTHTVCGSCGYYANKPASIKLENQ